jgi:hypothetical protein
VVANNRLVVCSWPERAWVAWPPMDKPPPDPQKLLAHWMEWERGETPPGRVLSNLKTAGLRELLEQLAAPSNQAASASSA